MLSSPTLDLCLAARLGGPDVWPPNILCHREKGHDGAHANAAFVWTDSRNVVTAQPQADVAVTLGPE